MKPPTQIARQQKSLTLTYSTIRSNMERLVLFSFGKSITGGHVYRGEAVSALNGYYIYADYVSGGVWGLKYDWSAKRTTENRSIPSSKLPVMSFGEDEEGELYYTTPIGAIFKLVPGK